MEAYLTMMVIGTLAFFGFVIYFIFKQMEFVVKAINLYEKMISRQDMQIKLLSNLAGGQLNDQISKLSDGKKEPQNTISTGNAKKCTHEGQTGKFCTQCGKETI